MPTPSFLSLGFLAVRGCKEAIVFFYPDVCRMTKMRVNVCSRLKAGADIDPLETLGIIYAILRSSTIVLLIRATGTGTSDRESSCLYTRLLPICFCLIYVQTPRNWRIVPCRLQNTADWAHRLRILCRCCRIFARRRLRHGLGCRNTRLASCTRMCCAPCFTTHCPAQNGCIRQESEHKLRQIPKQPGIRN